MITSLREHFKEVLQNDPALAGYLENVTQTEMQEVIQEVVVEMLYDSSRTPMVERLHD